MASCGSAAQRGMAMASCGSAAQRGMAMASCGSAAQRGMAMASCGSAAQRGMAMASCDSAAQRGMAMASCGSAAQRGLLPPLHEVSWPHTTQSVGLLWTSDQLVAETSTWQHTTHATDKYPCPLVGFEPTTAAGERPQTYALDRAATETDPELILQSVC
jgi:hypothetical protein